MFINIYAWAGALDKSQINLRTGLVAGHFDGTFEGDFEATYSFDIDWEFFAANNYSFLARYTQAMDTPDSRPFYNFTGLGMRFYFDSKGLAMIQDQSDVVIKSLPRWRYYVSTDLGVSQVIVKSFGPVVQALASMLETGLNAGALYLIGDKFSINAQVGATYGWGFSSTSANGYTYRALIGGSYFF